MATRFPTLKCNLLVGLLLLQPVVAQTQLDLRKQSRNVDFAAAASTRPAKTGTAMPSTCAVGELFFRSDSTAGKNLYGCTAVNTWTLQAESILPGSVANFVLSFTNQTTLSIPAAMHGFSSPNILVTCFDNGTPATLISPSVVTVHLTTFTVGVTFPGSRSGRCVLNAPGFAYTAGIGLVVNGAEFSVDSATVPSFLRGHGDLASWSIPDHACIDRTLPLEGSALIDAVIPGWPADLPDGLTGTMLVREPGLIGVRLCNSTSDQIEVPARTFNVAIIKAF